MPLAEHDVLAFDVYGTLVDTTGVLDRLTGIVGDRARSFSEAWRQQQLAYSFRRALMRDYVDFGTCTAQALDHTAATTGTTLTGEQRDDLLATYRRLPAFPDVAPGLERLAAEGRRLVAFSNGPVAAADELLVTADVRRHLHDVVSTDEIRSFKPDPAVYHHLLERVASVADRVVLVSSNSFDVLGAKAAGLAWDPPVPFRWSYSAVQGGGALGGWLLGATVGPGTLVVIVLLGPLVDVTSRLLRLDVHQTPDLPLLGVTGFEDLLAANRRHAAEFELTGLDGIAHAGVAIVTCMDSRIDPLGMVGLEPGDAKILRNPGGRVTDAALVALVLGVALLEVRRILVVQHTRCAMASASEAELQQRVGERLGRDASGLSIGAITDQQQALRADVRRVLSHPLLPAEVAVAGFVYDVDTGLLGDPVT